MESLAIRALPILLAVTFHEVAHGWVARKLGDPTAASQGRLSLNPLVHVDPVGTVLFPLMQYLFTGSVFFGWAKPVPVDPRYFRDPRKGMMWVALAGPATNIVLAVVSGLIVHLLLFIEPSIPGWVQAGAPTMLGQWLVPLWLMALFSIVINVALAAFNMMPIPPLDGSRVVYAILPRHLAASWARLERYGLLIVLGIIVLLPGALSVLIGPALLAAFTLLGVPTGWLGLLP